MLPKLILLFTLGAAVGCSLTVLLGWAFLFEKENL